METARTFGGQEAREPRAKLFAGTATPAHFLWDFSKLHGAHSIDFIHA